MPKKNEKPIQATVLTENVVAELDDSDAKKLYDLSRFGERTDDQFQYALVEGFYLFKKGKMILKSVHNRVISERKFMKDVLKHDPQFKVRYSVYADLRDRGYIAKTALKFGADFRVYDRGVKPGEDHAQWIVYPVHEGSALTWYEFAAKNRVAHSTRKRLLLGIVDEEGDVTYYECKWLKP
ncbi:tRNA-intron lyase [archaeon]|nr:tRNA-intron lyase [archaeon]|tara:strand:+ start:85 stop:627 length:543 start_codon:yes stop_codon:yes gene_type:complete